jgi:serine/threonine-protein kinase
MTRSLEELSLADMVADALAQQGIRAVVMEKDNGLEMSVRDARPVWIDATADLQQWSMLPVNIRQRKANLLAMRFLHIQRGGDGANPSKSTKPSFALPPWAAPFIDKAKELISSPRVKIGAAVVLAGGVIAAIVVLNHKEPPPPPPPDPSSETVGQRTARLGRACDATRVMMWRGGAWSSMPLEGWTVELWLSRQDGDPIADNAAIKTLVDGGKVHWGEKSAFATITDGQAQVIAGSAIAPRSDVTLVFHDGYARPFFDIDRRHEFIAMSEQIVKDTNADWGALYARCAHLTARDAGAWFYGRDPGKAAAALLFTMGKLVGSKGNDFAPYKRDFPGIAIATSSLDESKLFGIVYQDGARTTNRGGIFLTFPFGNPTNASQSSKRVAEELGL